MNAPLSPAAERTRDRIIAAALQLLVDEGRDAVSTRAIGAAARVQAPTIYRLFGDKQRLLDEVAAHGFREYLEGGILDHLTDDPVADLARGWDLHLEFGLANPYLYSLAYGAAVPGRSTPAARAASEILAALVHRLAEAGRLTVSEPDAVALLTTAGTGTTLTLIAQPIDARDAALSHRARDAAFAAILRDRPAHHDHGLVASAVHLRALAADAAPLTESERVLLRDWLDRIAAGRAHSG